MFSWMRRSGFPLAWERLLWSGRPALLGRVIRPRDEYHVTDFRAVVTHGGRTAAELAIHDLAHVDLQQTALQRLRGTSTLVLHPRDRGRTVVFADIRRGPQLALILELLATDPAGFELEPSLVGDVLGPDSPELFGRGRAWMALSAAALTVIAGFSVVAVARNDTPAPIAYSADDAIYPEGRKRPRAEIVAFMQRDVMPFARTALGPVVGGAERVTCFTCHGEDADARDWQMPAVVALPEPDFRLAGMERYASLVDSQMRNAVYGYLAEDTKQHLVGYMRGVVMPGMAGLLHRPAYDFTQTYGYNRARFAFGCYHCHMVSAPARPEGPSVPGVTPASAR